MSEPWGGAKSQRFVALTLREKGTICALCGLPGADSADHIKPRSKGGAVYDLANLQPAHRRCNLARGNRTIKGPQSLIEDGQAFFRTPTP